MKRTKIDLSPERNIVTNMIVSERFLKEILPVFRLDLMASQYTRTVASWILEYYERFKTAPEKNIQDIYFSKKKQIQDSEDAENVADFLEGLSEEYEEVAIHNVEYAISQSIHYLKIRSLEVLKERLEHAISEDNALQGEKEVSDFTRVEKPMGEGVNILLDHSKVVTAFLEEHELLFEFPGAAGQVAGRLNRGDFLSFLAPMKRGKTHAMWWAAETAATAGNRVVFFTLEMTENQMVRRAWQSLRARPRKTTKVQIPFFEQVLVSGEEKFVIKIREEEREGIDTMRVKDDQTVFRRMFRNGEIRIISAWGATVEDLSAHLDNLQYYENYIPDVIIVDYADIISPSRGFRGEYRHTLDDIWKKLRRMAQERSCGVITASQSERSTLTGEVSETSVSEDIRKLAHVTSMVGLNQSKQEKERGILRLSQLAVREGRQSFTQAVLLQSLDIGKFMVDSKLKEAVLFDDEDDEDDDPPKQQSSRRRSR